MYKPPLSLTCTCTLNFVHVHVHCKCSYNVHVHVLEKSIAHESKVCLQILHVHGLDCGHMYSILQLLHVCMYSYSVWKCIHVCIHMMYMYMYGGASELSQQSTVCSQVSAGP